MSAPRNRMHPAIACFAGCLIALYVGSIAGFTMQQVLSPRVIVVFDDRSANSADMTIRYSKPEKGEELIRLSSQSGFEIFADIYVDGHFFQQSLLLVTVESDNTASTTEIPLSHPLWWQVRHTVHYDGESLVVTTERKNLFAWNTRTFTAFLTAGKI